MTTGCPRSVENLAYFLASCADEEVSSPRLNKMMEDTTQSILYTSRTGCIWRSVEPVFRSQY